MPLPTSVIIATGVGIALSTTFSAASLALTYAAIPAILLPSDAPLMPPLVLEPGAKSDYDTDQAPKHPLDSGTGNKKEGILDSGATEKVLRTQKSGSGSPSSSSYLLRQWFHLFSKGMHSLAGLAVVAGLCHGWGLGNCIYREGITSKSWLFLFSTVMNVGIMVFTQTILKSTNDELHEIVARVVAQEKESRGTPDVDNERVGTEKLIREWGRINAVRALMPLSSVVSAISVLVL